MVKTLMYLIANTFIFHSIIKYILCYQKFRLKRTTHVFHYYKIHKNDLNDFFMIYITLKHISDIFHNFFP